MRLDKYPIGGGSGVICEGQHVVELSPRAAWEPGLLLNYTPPNVIGAMFQHLEGVLKH